jgi:hypothetical protein
MVVKRGWGRAVLTAACALGLIGCGSLAEKPPTAVNLTGHWHLNAAQSDDPRLLLAAQREYWRPMTHRPPEIRRSPADEVRTPFPAEVSSRGRSLMEFRERRDAAMNSLLWLDAEAIHIDQSPSALTISTEESSTRYVFGERTVVSVPNGAADRLAGWKDRTFIVSTRVPEGANVEQQYQLSADGRQLITLTELAGEGPHVTVRRVFDRGPR